MNPTHFIFGLCWLAAAVMLSTSAAIITQTHHVVEPVVAQIGHVVHSAPSAVSQQSFTRVHNKAVVTPIVAPLVKTTVHTSAPLVHAVHAVPVVGATTYTLHH